MHLKHKNKQELCVRYPAEDNCFWEWMDSFVIFFYGLTSHFMSDGGATQPAWGDCVFKHVNSDLCLWLWEEGQRSAKVLMFDITMIIFRLQGKHFLPNTIRNTNKCHTELTHYTIHTALRWEDMGGSCSKYAEVNNNGFISRHNQ